MPPTVCRGSMQVVTALFSVIVILHVRLHDSSLCRNFWFDQAKSAPDINSWFLVWSYLESESSLPLILLVLCPWMSLNLRYRTHIPLDSITLWILWGESYIGIRMLAELFMRFSIPRMISSTITGYSSSNVRKYQHSPGWGVHRRSPDEFDGDPQIHCCARGGHHLCFWLLDLLCRRSQWLQ